MPSNMAWTILIILLLLVILVYGFRKKLKKPEVETYVCDSCGSKECVCHKDQG
jgi:hypothetical protein